jgi:DNA-binding NtrC family response regulator
MRTVLFLDDHHAYRTVLAEVLRNAGYKVLEAATPWETQHLLEGQPEPVDVLVIEAVLSSTNGSVVAKRVRERHPEIQVLFISDQPAEVLRKQALLPEGEEFLNKNLPADAMIAVLHQLVHDKAKASQ